MDEERRIPVNPASTIGAGYGIPIQQPPPIRLPNVGMGAMGMPKIRENIHVELRNPLADGGGSIKLEGAFFTIFLEDDITYLQGGTVSAGDGTRTIPKIELIDDMGVLAGAEDHHIWIEVTGDGYAEDGVLLAGYDLTAAIVSIGDPVPDNTLPTFDSTSGKKVHISLGVFTATGFLPAALGNVQISFCPGSYNVSRS